MKDKKAARKLLVKQVPFSRTTVEKILKEKFTHGDVIDGACPRSRLRRFDKLSIEQKEDIRKLVLIFLFRLEVGCLFAYHNMEI